ncbi:hypothetical protein Plhal304r1_c072g0160681 [Plasmopara halstedii]
MLPYHHHSNSKSTELSGIQYQGLQPRLEDSSIIYLSCLLLHGLHAWKRAVRWLTISTKSRHL